MAVYATYDIVADGTTLLNSTRNDAVNNQHDFELEFNEKVDFGKSSVLSYMVNPSSSGVVFEMSVSNLLSNGTDDFKVIVPSTNLPSLPSFLRQEVITGNTFTRVNGPGLGVHKLRIRVISGAAYFSDIVHMYLKND